MISLRNIEIGKGKRNIGLFLTRPRNMSVSGHDGMAWMTRVKQDCLTITFKQHLYVH